MQKPVATQRKLLLEYKKTLILSPLLFDVGVGTLLGDASIQTQDNGKTYRLKYSQAINLHSEYLNHLHEIWSDWVLSEKPRKEKNREMLSFQTISHSELKKLAQLFVIDTQKNPCRKYITPNLIEDYLSPRALAYWIMDDGGRSCYNLDFERKGFTLNCHSFSKQNVEILCGGLKNRYGVECWSKKNKGKYVVTISGHCDNTILSLIQPFLIPSMLHKIPGFPVK